MTVLCQNRGCKSAKKLTYQQTKNRFDVTSFILLSEGREYTSDYNLKSREDKHSQTSYTEADIQQMKAQQLRAEQEKLKKQQQEEKKKLQKQKKASKTRSSKKNTNKKSTQMTSKMKICNYQPYIYSKSCSKGRPPYKICAWMWTHHAYLAGLE